MSGLGLECPRLPRGPRLTTVGPSPAAGNDGWERWSKVRHLQCPQASQNHRMLAPEGPYQPSRRLHLPHKMPSPLPKEELLMRSLGGDPSLEREAGGRGWHVHQL